MQTLPSLPNNVEELQALLTAQIALVDTLRFERDAFRVEAESLKVVTLSLIVVSDRCNGTTRHRKYRASDDRNYGANW